MQLTAPAASLHGLRVVNAAGGWPAIVVKGGSRATLRRLLIESQDPQGLCGVLVEGGARPIIEDTIIRGVAEHGAGVSFRGEGTGGRLARCIVERPASDGIRVYAQAAPTIIQCRVSVGDVFLMRLFRGDSSKRSHHHTRRRFGLRQQHKQ